MRDYVCIFILNTKQILKRFLMLITHCFMLFVIIMLYTLEDLKWDL